MTRPLLLAAALLVSTAAVLAALPGGGEAPGDPATPAPRTPRTEPPTDRLAASASPPPARLPEPEIPEVRIAGTEELPPAPARRTPREVLQGALADEDSLPRHPAPDALVAELAAGLAGDGFTETEAHLALRVLSRIPGHATEAVLVGVATDGWATSRRRRLAVLALGDAGGRTAVGVLFDLAAGAADPEDLRLAAQSLVRIARRLEDRSLLSELRDRIEPRLVALLPAARSAGDEDAFADLAATIAELRGVADPEALLRELTGPEPLPVKPSAEGP